jgi:hypothetical protein
MTSLRDPRRSQAGAHVGVRGGALVLTSCWRKPETSEELPVGPESRVAYRRYATTDLEVFGSGRRVIASSAFTVSYGA